jgi:hypothetical protein
VVGEPELVGGSPGPVAAEPIALEPGVLAGEVRAAGQLRAGAGLADTATASSVHRGGVATRLAGVDESRVLVHTPAIATARWSGNLGCGGVWPGLGLGSSGNWRYPDPCGLSQADPLSFLDGVLGVPCSVLGSESFTEARFQNHEAQRGFQGPLRGFITLRRSWGTCRTTQCGDQGQGDQGNEGNPAKLHDTGNSCSGSEASGATGLPTLGRATAPALPGETGSGGCGAAWAGTLARIRA